MLLCEWRSDEPTGLLSRVRVIDMLLDLRIEVEPRQRPIVDAVLSAVPGSNLVEATWWVDTLDKLSMTLGCDPTTS